MAVLDHHLRRPPLEQAPIEISYRDEGNGNGPFYDHYTIQRATLRETFISLPPQMATQALVSFIKTGTTHNLYFGALDKEGKRIPRVSQPTDPVGLLVIPGHARETETKRASVLEIRNMHERALLRNAFHRGRPILGICAGSWQIWNVFNEVVRFRIKEATAELVFDGTTSVKDHAWRQMPTINNDGSIGHNTQMHPVSIPSHSMLAGMAIEGWQVYKRQSASLQQIHPDLTLLVNSVHWKAPGKWTVPRTEETVTKKEAPHIRDILQVNAASLPYDKNTPKGKTPEPDVIEGFELASGAPLLGIEWHPESYENDGQPNSRFCRSILSYMARAGDAYAAKQKMLAALKEKIEMNALSSLLKNMHLG